MLGLPPLWLNENVDYYNLFMPSAPSFAICLARFHLGMRGAERTESGASSLIYLTPNGSSMLMQDSTLC